MLDLHTVYAPVHSSAGPGHELRPKKFGDKTQLTRFNTRRKRRRGGEYYIYRDDCY